MHRSIRPLAAIAHRANVTTVATTEAIMKTLGLRDAKASLSAVVEAAERGEATTITKHGRPAAVVVPVKETKRLYPLDRPSFAGLLLCIPYALEFDRVPSHLR